MKHLNSGILALADGTVFEGVSVGYEGYACGEVVFNTAQSGYQEILTDPSYTEQLITFTQPHIGNVGMNAFDRESDRIWANGVIMRSFSETASHWQSEETLEHFFYVQKTIAVSEIDTRALTHHLRRFGSQSGCLMAGDADVEKALDYAKRCPNLLGKDLARQVGVQDIFAWYHDESFDHHIVVMDFGVKRSILRCLVERGCSVTLVPATTPVSAILALKPDGVVLSNGPGDPAACLDVQETIQALLDCNLPMMGICLGQQLLALTSGATTQKMRFGHHGANHPIQSLKTGEVSVSSQNHGFVVAEENLPSHLRVTHRSLFDSTIAGLERLDVPAFGFQGHPEAGPGPTEWQCLFDQFVHLVEA